MIGCDYLKIGNDRNLFFAVPCAIIILNEESNKALQVEVDKLSQRIVDIAAENALTDQYLRINNLEIVGLPELGDGETAEDEEVILIEALNSIYPNQLRPMILIYRI